MNCIVCLSLTSDSRLPMDLPNGLDLSLGRRNLGIDSVDVTSFIKKWLHLQSISTVNETDNILIKFWSKMPKYYYYIETIFLCIIFIIFLLHCWMPEYLFCNVWFASLGGFCHFPFSFSKLMGYFMWNTNLIWKDIYAK